MNHIKTKFVFLGLMTSLCSFADTNTPIHFGPNLTIPFEVGKSKLSGDAKGMLTAYVKEVESKGEIKEIQIASWSDNPAPADKQELSKPDQKLATHRGEAIKKYLTKTLMVKDVSLHSMAEKSSWLTRILTSNEAEMKTDMSIRVFKENGKPSHSVILTIYKN